MRKKRDHEYNKFLVRLTNTAIGLTFHARDRRAAPHGSPRIEGGL